MSENANANETPNRNDCSESPDEYLRRAAEACETGDLMLGMHLYLAAYEQAQANSAVPGGRALSGLRSAWNLACELKERSMAEFVFEKLEPYLTGEEIAECAGKLQMLALERLEEYGFSVEELQDMANMISQDFGGDASVVKVESISIPHVSALGGAMQQGDAFEDAHPAHSAWQKEDETMDPNNKQDAAAAADESVQNDAGEPAIGAEAPGEAAKRGFGVADVNDFNPYDMYRDYSVGKSFHAATVEGSGAHVFTRDTERAEALAKYEAARAQEAAAAELDAKREEEPHAPAAGDGATPPAPAAGDAQAAAPVLEKPQEASTPQIEDATGRSEQEPLDDTVQGTDAPIPGIVPKSVKQMRAAARATAPISPGVKNPTSDRLDFSSLAGYDEAISVMRDMGIGMQNDPAFLEFVAMLNEQHGLSRAPSLDTVLFRSPAIEDAGRFIDAVVGELGLPVLRMAMEEGLQGAPVLCVMTQGNNRPRMNHAQNRFEGPAILILDDLGMWSMPEPAENMDGIGGFVMANISRGAREAVNLIRSAVEDPDVYVFSSMSSAGEADPFFYDLLEPLTVVDIAYPNEKERADIWTEIARDHPSMRAIDRAELMRLSAGMPRYDMYMAAREAVEEAYKAGLMSRTYIPVTPQNIFEKIAAYQPYDSDEYRALEDEVVRNFKLDLDDLDGLFDR